MCYIKCVGNTVLHQNVSEQYACVCVRRNYDRIKTVWTKSVKIKCIRTTLVRKNMLLQNVLEKTIGIVIISKYFFE